VKQVRYYNNAAKQIGYYKTTPREKMAGSEMIFLVNFDSEIDIRGQLDRKIFIFKQHTGCLEKMSLPYLG